MHYVCFLFSCILQAKATVHMMAAQFINQNIEIKNKKVISNHENIWFKEARIFHKTGISFF